MKPSTVRTVVILTGTPGRDDACRISEAVGRISTTSGTTEVELIGATDRSRRADLLAYARIEYGLTRVDHLGELARPHNWLRAIADELDARGHRTRVRAMPARLVVDEAIATLDDARHSGLVVDVIVRQSPGWSGRQWIGGRRSRRVIRGIRKLGFAQTGARPAGRRRSVLLEYSIPVSPATRAVRCAPQQDWRDHPLRSELDGAGDPWSMNASRGVKTHRPVPDTTLDPNRSHPRHGERCVTGPCGPAELDDLHLDDLRLDSVSDERRP